MWLVLYCHPRWRYHSVTGWTCCGQAITHAMHIYLKARLFEAGLTKPRVIAKLESRYDTLESSIPFVNSLMIGLCVQMDATCNIEQRSVRVRGVSDCVVTTNFSFFSLGPVTNLRATSKNKTAVVLAWGTPQSGIGTITAPQVIFLAIFALGSFLPSRLCHWLNLRHLSHSFFLVAKNFMS